VPRTGTALLASSLNQSGLCRCPCARQEEGAISWWQRVRGGREDKCCRESWSRVYGDLRVCMSVNLQDMSDNVSWRGRDTES
jgi:hypothetical protein